MGPTITKSQGIIGESVDLTLERLEDVRKSSLIMQLTTHLLMTKWQDADGDPKVHLFGQLKRIVRKWLDECLECQGDTYPALLMYRALADTACDRITAAIVQKQVKEDRPVLAVIDPYNPTALVSTSALIRPKTSAGSVIRVRVISIGRFWTVPGRANSAELLRSIPRLCHT